MTEPPAPRGVRDLVGDTVANRMVLSLPSIPDTVPRLRHLLVAFAAVHGADERLCEDIALCMSEAVTNAVLHGHDRDPGGTVHLAAQVQDSALEIVVADNGRGLSADVDSDGLGLGLGLIAKSAARFAVRDREPAGTEVWMRFELP